MLNAEVRVLTGISEILNVADLGGWGEKEEKKLYVEGTQWNLKTPSTLFRRAA